MQVNFNGLYKISGSWENSKGRGDTMHDISTRKMQAFLEDTKEYMDPKGCTYMNGKNKDLYFTVKPESEENFEFAVADYNIDCRRVADNVSQNRNLPKGLNLCA